MRQTVAETLIHRHAGITRRAGLQQLGVFDHYFGA
jgi:hypothetical protein